MDRETAVAQPLPSVLADDRWFRADPGHWLPGARAAGPDRWRVELRAFGRHRPVTATVGRPLLTASGVTRHLGLRPSTTPADLVEGERFLPAFVGRLRLVLGAGGASLVLVGSVHAPLGLVGGLVDQLATGAVADGSLRDLLARTAERAAAAASAGDTTAVDGSVTGGG